MDSGFAGMTKEEMSFRRNDEDNCFAVSSPFVASHLPLRHPGESRGPFVSATREAAANGFRLAPE
jgi:hypothetical protein